MFGRIARKVLDVFAAIENVAPTNRVRLACEGLEDRRTPAAFTVDTAGDGQDHDLGDGKAGYPYDGPGGWQTSLRSAIEQGNYDATKGSTNHTIAFDSPKVGPVISLSKALPDLKANFTIGGPGPELLAITRPSDALTRFRIFTVPQGRIVNIQNLTVSGGSTPDDGGGISSEGELTVEQCVVSNNQADGYGGGVRAFSGTLRVNRTWIYSNLANLAGGYRYGYICFSV
jgi:hypothetical protein